MWACPMAFSRCPRQTSLTPAAAIAWELPCLHISHDPESPVVQWDGVAPPPETVAVWQCTWATFGTLVELWAMKTVVRQEPVACRQT